MFCSWRDNSSYKLNNLCPLCLWQCLFIIIIMVIIIFMVMMMTIIVIRQCDEHVSAGDRCQTPIDGRFLPPKPSSLIVVITDIDFLLRPELFIKNMYVVYGKIWISLTNIARGGLVFCTIGIYAFISCANSISMCFVKTFDHEDTNLHWLHLFDF